MVGGYTENPEKPLNCQNWGVGTCVGRGACPEQYSSDCMVFCFVQVIFLFVQLSSCEVSGTRVTKRYEILGCV